MDASIARGGSGFQSLWTPKWLAIGFLAAAYAITQLNAVMYVALAIELSSLLSTTRRCTNNEKALNAIDLLVVTVMMPDNYCVIFGLLYAFLAVGRRKFSRRAAVLFLLAASYCAGNIILRSVPLNNVVMACVYSGPFFLAYGVSRKLSDGYAGDLGHIAVILKRYVAIELLAVLLYAVTHLSAIAAYDDMDWVVGTLGAYQANTLMCTAAFALLVFLGAARNGERGFLPWCVFAGILTVSTSSVSFTAVLAASFTVVFIFSFNIRFWERAAVVAVLGGGALVFVAVSPAWISNEMVKMTDLTYAQNRLEKLVYFERTFDDLPTSEGTSCYLFGTGLGTYSSRAAMTCGGGYIDAYDKAFAPYNSYFRLKYLSDQDRKKGLASVADSSVVATQGELGFIGLAALVALVAFLFTGSKDPFYRVTVLFFVGLLFVDNALEYAKYYSLFFMALTYTKTSTHAVAKSSALFSHI